VLLVVVVHTHGVDHVRNDVAVATAHDADLTRTPEKRPTLNCTVVEIPLPAATAPAVALMSDFATVPKLLLCSFVVMPIPKSPMVMVKFVSSGAFLMKSYGRASKF